MMPQPLSSGFTVGCWFNFSTMADGPAMANYGGAGGNGWKLQLATVNSDTFFVYRSDEEDLSSFGTPPKATGVTYFLGGWYDGANSCALENDTLLDCKSHTTGLTNGAEPFLIGVHTNSSNLNVDVTIGGCVAFNAALNQANLTDLYTNWIQSPSAGGDTDPPTILNLNCTSCNIPNGDITSPYETEDTTPTFVITTDENADCRIGGADQNYTAMGTTRNCSTTGGTGHTCSLTTQDRFTNVGENYLYISCKDSSGNEGNVSDTSKSNSGPIRMGIEGAGETGGDGAIEVGITASEVGGTATIYSSQQVSARDLSNNQFLGIFDKVAVNGDKRWAFNYVSGGESPLTELFNLTPVLYVLQLQNQTNETITDKVGKLINNTYP